MALIFRPPCTTYSLFSRTKNLICFSRFNAPLLCTCAANVGEIYTMRQKKEPIFCTHLFSYLTETDDFFTYIRPKESRSIKLQFRLFNLGMR